MSAVQPHTMDRLIAPARATAALLGLMLYTASLLALLALLLPAGLLQSANAREDDDPYLDC